MPFKKFVEIGRVAVLNGEGPNQGKIAAIVNVIDQNRVLVDGPTSGVLRQAYPIKQLQLTPIAVKFPFNASTKTVRGTEVAPARSRGRRCSTSPMARASRRCRCARARCRRST